MKLTRYVLSPRPLAVRRRDHSNFRPRVLSIAETVLGFIPTARHAHFCNFLDADSQTIDQGIALYFSGPNSFTGEDVLELQGHGGMYVLKDLLDRVASIGARTGKSRRVFRASISQQ